MLVNAGRIYTLKVLTGQISPELINMGLYTNTLTWTAATVLGGLTEVAVSGYARQSTGSYTTPVIAGGGYGTTTGTSCVFSNTSGAGVTVTGFFYVTATTSVFLGGDNFAVPLVIPATIGSLSVIPELQDSTYP